ncbi:hypothetical protein Bbelb_020000 [Branchiostoma belcheri]|nr:hypothetical protein Bbelb_020000 [Branchiostoma belcheri]
MSACESVVSVVPQPTFPGRQRRKATLHYLKANTPRKATRQDVDSVSRPNADVVPPEAVKLALELACTSMKLHSTPTPNDNDKHRDFVGNFPFTYPGVPVNLRGATEFLRNLDAG